MKDHFSEQSGRYAVYRPDYTDEIFKYLCSLTDNRDKAWDCGTGNGQIAVGLANCFESVYATDISKNQLNHARQSDRVFYSQQPAEKTDFSDAYFDLIVVSQAIHWFDIEAFYKEVYRTLKDDGHIVVMGYDLVHLEGELDKLIHQFYSETLGSYWDPERQYLDEKYQTIPFPFKEVQTPDFNIEYQWTADQLLGYLSTWSAVKNYINQNGSDPLQLIEAPLRKWWGKSVKKVSFTVILRHGTKLRKKLGKNI